MGICDIKVVENNNLEISLGKCVFCHSEVYVNSFKDKLSLKEFKISCICQSCQDEFFED